MKFKIKNCNVFEKGLEKKFKKVLLENAHKFNKDNQYEMRISFYYSPIKDEKSICNEITSCKSENDKDRLYKALQLQIERIKEISKNLGIIFKNITMEGLGDSEDLQDMIIEINCINKKTRVYVSSVIPYRDNLINNLQNAANEQFNKLFNSFLASDDYESISMILGFDPPINNKDRIFTKYVKEVFLKLDDEEVKSLLENNIEKAIEKLSKKSKHI